MLDAGHRNPNRMRALFLTASWMAFAMATAFGSAFRFSVTILVSPGWSRHIEQDFLYPSHAEIFGLPASGTLESELVGGMIAECVQNRHPARRPESLG